MCHLLYLLYCLNLFVHSMMLLVKTIETKKEICHNQNRRFLFSLLSLCSLLLIVVPCFLVAASRTSADIARRTFLFFELAISEFVLRMDCWLLSWIRFQLYEWHTKEYGSHKSFTKLQNDHGVCDSIPFFVNSHHYQQLLLRSFEDSNCILAKLSSKALTSLSELPLLSVSVSSNGI